LALLSVRTSGFSYYNQSTDSTVYQSLKPKAGILQEPQEKSSKDSLISKIAKQVLAIGFGGLFLWLAFKNADVGKIWNYAKGVDPLWLGALTLCCVASHVVRAYRWTIFLQPLTSRKVGLFNTFAAIMLGYAVNLVIPRGGEVVRIVSISKSEGLPWAGVLPTMLIDRLMDIAVLCLILAATMPILPPQMLAVMTAAVPPRLLAILPVELLLKVGGGVMALGSIFLLVILPKIADLIRFVITVDFVKKILPAKLIGIAEDLAGQFQEGTKSLSNLSTYPAVLVSTFVMWWLYFMNQYFLLQGFHLIPQVTLMQQWISYTIGSVGVLIPSPGSIGSFHFFASKALIWSAGVDESLALAFATVMHLVSFIIVACVCALICGIVQANRPALPPAPPPPEPAVPKAST
jgi:uncharacterized protein (TIRG00374 family)